MGPTGAGHRPDGQRGTTPGQLQHHELQHDVLPWHGPQQAHVPLPVREPAGVLLERDLDHPCLEVAGKLLPEAEGGGPRHDFHGVPLGQARSAISKPRRSVVLRAFGDINESVDAYSWVALAPETGAIMNAIGIPTTLGPVAGNTAPGLTFRTEGGLWVTVVITSACSGIYSFAIFASAFTAFVMTEQKRLTKRVVAFFALGVFLAYLANILRMVAIAYIGYKYDTPQEGVNNLLIAHSNLGWIIFLAWIALFWMLLFRFLPREAPTSTPEATPAPRLRGTFCGICGIVLTPAIPATQCNCGKLSRRVSQCGGRLPELPSAPAILSGGRPPRHLGRCGPVCGGHPRRLASPCRQSPWS